MSAFYAMAHADRIEILTDGAIYADDGTVVDLEYKVWSPSSMPLAVTGRGSHGAVSAMALSICGAASVLSSVDETIASVQRILAEKRGLPNVAMVDMLIACISETLGPKIFYFTTWPDFEGVEPFLVYDAGMEHGGGPNPSREDLAACGFPEGSEVSSLGDSGADLFEALRRTKMEHLTAPGKPMLYGVGGHVDLTVVSPFGVETTRLRTWEDDQVGRPINPYPVLRREAA